MVHANGKLKVFVMWGQSNMEGKGRAKHIPCLIADPAKAPDFKHLMKGDEFVVRKDVWVWFSEKRGDLTVGFGNSGAAETPGKDGKLPDKMFGPELGFGHVVGDHFDDQVLLIKCAWGGKSLAVDFLPPSSGGPGPYYTQAMQQTKDVLGDIKKYFPEYGGSYELCGMVWFQGWNDLKTTEGYTQRLANLIKDVRKELNAPHLPVVIGETGQGGVVERKPGEAPDNMTKLREAQRATAELPEFKGDVAFVPTTQFHLQELEPFPKLYFQCKNAGYEIQNRNLQAMGLTRKQWKEMPAPKSQEIHEKTKATKEQIDKAWEPWRKVEAEWQAKGGDGGYHFFGSGEINYRIGDALGKAMLNLLGEED